MQPTILITDGGPHPADKWAAVTASHIAALIEVNDKSISPEAVAARKAKPRFELAVADVLEGHHDAVQQMERGKIKELGDARLGHSGDVKDHAPDTVEQAVAAVTNAAKGTPFADHFKVPAVLDVVRKIVSAHFSHAIAIERSWHADRNPTGKEARKLIAARSIGIAAV